MATKKASSTKTAAKAPAKAAAKKPAAKTTKSGSKGGKLRLIAASPSFTVNDVEKSLAWYRDVLGCKVSERWESEGKLMGVELEAGDVTFMIGQDDWKKGKKRVKGVAVRLYCVTRQNLDQVAARIKANGGTLTQEPKDQPWGMRDLAIDDPDGFKITIAQQGRKR